LGRLGKDARTREASVSPPKTRIEATHRITWHIQPQTLSAKTGEESTSKYSNVDIVKSKITRREVYSQGLAQAYLVNRVQNMQSKSFGVYSG
jgi:hypothetical protein